MNVKQAAIQNARVLRKNRTTAEKKFWSIVRNKKIQGYKFLRQYPIYFEWENKTRFFIADFYCDDLRLVVEIDGGIHEQQKEYDLLRDKIIKFSIVRFSNNDVLKNSGTIIKTLKDTLLALSKKPPPSPPLTLQGRGAEGGEGQP